MTETDPVLALARSLAALYGAELFCRCGRDWIADDGTCPRCTDTDEINWRAERAVWAERVRRHELALTVECPYCGAAPGSVCVTTPGRAAKGVDDHRDRYRAAEHLLARLDPDGSLR